MKATECKREDGEGVKEEEEEEEEENQWGQRERFALVNVTVNIGFNPVNSSRLFEFLLCSQLLKRGRKDTEEVKVTEVKFILLYISDDEHKWKFIVYHEKTHSSLSQCETCEITSR